MRLLIVEDEAPIAEVVAAYAGREGYETLWTADGEATMSLYQFAFKRGLCASWPP